MAISLSNYKDLFLSLKAESEEAEVALDAKNQIKDNLQALTLIFEQYKYFMSDEYSGRYVFVTICGDLDTGILN